MSGAPVIRVESLGKNYLLRHASPRYLALRDVITQSVRRCGYRIIHPFHFTVKKERERFWALRDVSFDVNNGDRLGIIGRNGAGKSTLLKILARITEPSEGRVRVKGRVSSLLEIGTGFHPELTGRENIFLSGAVLGMSRTEIKRNFDAIVDFAEVERFLDTPVKHYSSGMYVRLAFAVAAHLSTRTLLVDEVLAVGDIQFQKKCLGKMENISQEGRTILFVSHNMNAVEQLCNSALILESGRLKLHGTDVRSVIKEYIVGNSGSALPSQWQAGEQKIHENRWIMPIRFALTDRDGTALSMPVANNSEMWVQIDAEIKEPDPALQLGYAIYTEDGVLLFWTCHTDVGQEKWPKLEKGPCSIRSKIPDRFLNEGTYRIEMIVALYFRMWLCEPGRNAPAIYLSIQGGLSDSPYWMIKRPGVMAPVVEWTVLQ